MTTDIDTHDDASTCTRRHVLTLVGLVAATGRVSAQSDGDVAVGGGGADHDFRYGAWSFAPSTLPPDAAGGWVQRDAGGTASFRRVRDTLPQTFTANGAEWSFASDLATAKSNTTTTPWVAVGDAGLSVDPAESLPATWTGGGVTHAVAGDLATADAERGSATPAVLFAPGAMRVITA